MKKILLLFVVAITLNSCFSAKGLPIKTVDDTQETEQDVQAPIENVSSNEEVVEENQEDNSNLDQVNTNNISTAVLDHSSFDALLKKYVANNGDVNYKGFKKSASKLNEYINYLEQQHPKESWSVETQLAYFINVYNANTIKLILDNYPTKSIKDISSPWLKDRFKIAGKDFSLAGLENGILRKMNEPKIHFAINCASASCPKLLDEAYTEANVMALMDRATKEFINNSKKNELGKNTAKISEIFKWYKSDFKEAGSIIDYINNYSDVKINPNVKVEYLSYDWSLNEQN